MGMYVIGVQQTEPKAGGGGGYRRVMKMVRAYCIRHNNNSVMGSLCLNLDKRAPWLPTVGLSVSLTSVFHPWKALKCNGNKKVVHPEHTGGARREVRAIGRKKTLCP